MKTILVMAIAGTLAAGTSVAAAGCGSCGATASTKAEEKKVKMQTACPVMGGKINKDLYVDQAGKRIYVCCKGCIAPVQKDFKKHAEKVAAAGETVATIQTTCPVMGGKINKKQYADVKGKRIYVCCPGCIGKIKSELEDHAFTVTFEDVPGSLPDEETLV